MAAQSDFFDGLFTFEDKMEYNITNPEIHQFLTTENFKMVLDTFYEIEPDFDEEKALDMTILANYFLAPFLMKKCIRILVIDLGLDPIRVSPMMTEKQSEINDLLEFAKQWSLDELHKAIFKNLPSRFFSLSKPCMSENSRLTKLKRKNDMRGSSL